ncbi:MAG: threonine/serine exporter family protein, partial [Methanobacterium paludis]|nr:threonine/serine exporter family protein [Methanobacterium paludis]
AILLLLLFGLIVGLEIAGLPLQQLMFISPSTTSIWWIPYIGVLVFGVGMYLFMSIERRDMPWIILILYIAFMGEQIGNQFVGGFFGGFLGSLLMAVSGTLTERYDHGTPSFISILPAFWILVPGSLGFISLASLVGQNYPAAINNALLVTMTIVAISLGLLVGRILTEPLKVEK